MGSILEQLAKQLGKKSTANVLRVSRFEDPVPTLELISHICSAPEAPSLGECFASYRKGVGEMEQESSKAKYLYYKDVFTYELRNYGKRLQSDIENGSYKSGGVKVAVAGGYSAGKSTFLNCITKSGKLLPVGIEPTSVVMTFVNCSCDNKSVAVRGENVAGNKVLLSPDVLESIRHTSAGQNSVAGVLNKLIVDIPAADDYMDGIVFIDTPGYNNSASKDIGDASSDREVALSCFKKADFILWCVDVETGTVSREDLDVLARRKKKGEVRTPYALVVTKPKLKTPSGLLNVMRQMRKACVDRFGEADAPAAVICFDRTENGFVFGALDGLKIQGLFDMIREQSSKSASVTDYQGLVRKCFEDERAVSKKCCEEQDEKRVKTLRFRNSLSNLSHKYDGVIGTSSISICNEAQSEFEGMVSECKAILDREEDFQKFLDKWKPTLLNKLSEAADDAIRIRESFLQKLRPPEPMLVEGSVFDAIGGGDYQLFLRCFDKGVDLASTNSGGYNVLTYVAHVGDTPMMRFLIKHDADLSLTDANGRDALAEAAACHFRDVCEMLLEADTSLAAGRKDELTQAANNDDFVKWLTNKL